MPDKNVVKLQFLAREKFREFFTDVDVIVRKPSMFRISPDIYSPDPDVAVGPLSIGRERFIDKYNTMAIKSKIFIEHCMKMHNENQETYGISFDRQQEFKFFCDEKGYPTSINKNPRCFIAVEIENTGTSRKHLMGSAINAVALGRIGILVGYTDERVRMFLRCLKYLNFLKSVGKPGIDFENGLVLSRKQFIEALSLLDKSEKKS